MCSGTDYRGPPVLWKEFGEAPRNSLKSRKVPQMTGNPAEAKIPQKSAFPSAQQCG